MSYDIWDAAKDALSGKLKLVSKDVADERMNICNACDAKNHTLNTCTACGCFLPAKTRLQESTCPMELW